VHQSKLSRRIRKRKTATRNVHQSKLSLCILERKRKTALV
jgi:hypothetical protein